MRREIDDAVAEAVGLDRHWLERVRAAPLPRACHNGVFGSGLDPPSALRSSLQWLYSIGGEGWPESTEGGRPSIPKSLDEVDLLPLSKEFLAFLQKYPPLQAIGNTPLARIPTVAAARPSSPSTSI